MQDIMVKSEQNSLVLQDRIRELENEIGFRSGKTFSNSIREEPVTIDGVRSSRHGKISDSVHLFADRFTPPQVVNKTYMHFEDSIHEDAYGTMHLGSVGKIGGAYMLNGHGASASHLSKIDVEGNGNEHTGKRRVWDRIPRPVKFGEGPSARSVWQASKDETTLAAIRGMGEDVEPPELDGRMGSGFEGQAYKSMNGLKKSQYNNLGSSIMELIHVGDMEAVYRQVLSTEDEFTLIRLMSRTGPVLDQLTYVTATHVLSVAGQFLQQQSYGEVCLPWMQQVSISQSGSC
jgi:hypothetical protein